MSVEVLTSKRTCPKPVYKENFAIQVLGGFGFKVQWTFSELKWTTYHRILKDVQKKFYTFSSTNALKTIGERGTASKSMGLPWDFGTDV